MEAAVVGVGVVVVVGGGGAVGAWGAAERAGRVS